MALTSRKGKTKFELAGQIMADIREFQKNNDIDRLVMIWCGSTEVFFKMSDVHSTVAKFEKGLKSNDPKISPSMIYAYAALKMGIPLPTELPI